jgi:type II secretory pathway component PulF
MNAPEIPILLAIAGPLLFGIAILVSLRILLGDCETRGDLMQIVMRTAAWSLIASSAMAVVVLVFAGIPGIILMVVAAMVWMRHRRTQQFVLLSTMAVAAERMMPMQPVIEAFAREHRWKLAAEARRLASRLEAGWLLPDAVDASGKLFPPEARVTIRVGHAAGTLAEALRNAAGGRDSHDAVWSQVAGKVLYLAFVVFFGNLMVTFLMLKIAPAMQKIFVDFDAELPAITLLCFFVSGSTALYGGFLSAILFPAMGLFTYYCLFRYIGWIHWDLPGVTRLLRRLHTAAILDALATVAQRNQSFRDAIATLARGYPKRAIRRRLRRVLADLEAGVDWCDSLARRGLIRPADRAVLQAASRAGNLPWALREMADSNRRRFAYRAHTWLQVLFTLVILMFGLIVLLFVVSYFLPLISLIRNLV